VVGRHYANVNEGEKMADSHFHHNASEIWTVKGEPLSHCHRGFGNISERTANYEAAGGG